MFKYRTERRTTMWFQFLAFVVADSMPIVGGVAHTGYGAAQNFAPLTDTRDIDDEPRVDRV